MERVKIEHVGTCTVCRGAILVGPSSHGFGWVCQCACTRVWEKTRDESVREHEAKMKFNAIRLAEMEGDHE